MAEQKDPDSSSPWVLIARYSEIGFIIPAAVLMGFIVGKLADYLLKTSWIYLAGLIFGAVIGFVQMIRMATAASREK